PEEPTVCHTYGRRVLSLDLETGVGLSGVCIRRRYCLFRKLLGDGHLTRGFLFQNFSRQSLIINESCRALAEFGDWQTVRDRFGELDAETDDGIEARVSKMLADFFSHRFGEVRPRGIRRDLRTCMDVFTYISGKQ